MTEIHKSARTHQFSTTCLILLTFSCYLREANSPGVQNSDFFFSFVDLSVPDCKLLWSSASPSSPPSTWQPPQYLLNESMMKKTDEKDPQSPFTFRNKFSFRYCAVKLSTVLAGERELIHTSRMRMDFLSHLAGGLQQKTIPCRRSIPCAVFQMLILTSTKARHMLWSVMGLCAKRLK